MSKFAEQSQKIIQPNTQLDKTIRLLELERKLEEGPFNRTIYNEICRLRQQLYKPTARQQEVGFRPGRLKKEDEDYVKVRTLTRAILEELNPETL